MKHAGSEALGELAELLVELRKVESLKEKKPGVFYLKSSAFLHFHEDPTGLFADLRTAEDWDRIPVTTRTQRKAFLSRVKSALQRTSG